MNEIAAFIIAVSHVTNVAKAFFQAKSDSIRDTARSELLEMLLDLNAKAMSIQALYQKESESVVALKAQLAAYDKWEQESARYSFRKVGDASFVYALDPAQASNQAPHWLCPNCYKDRKKSVL